MARNDDDEDDDRPRRRRSRDEDDDDEDDDRPRRKKKKKAKPSRPLPGLLLAMVIIAWVWGGLCFFSTAGQVLNSLSELWRALANQAGANPFGIRFQISTMSKIMMGVDVLFCAANFLLSIGIIAGGFLLFFRRAIGRNLVVFCPVGMAGCLVLSAIAMGIALGGALGLIWLLLIGYGIGIAIHLVVAFVFLKLQEYPDVHRALH